MKELKRIKCPCCGYYTFVTYMGDRPLFEICEVCFWQYEETSHDKTDKPSGGANGMLSLNEARENYKKFGACELKLKNLVRQPLKEELTGNE